MKLSKNGKRMGRPPMTETKPSISITEACGVMMYVAKDIKNLCIAFDNRMDKVEVSWHEAVYTVDMVEMPKTIDAIKFLQSKELQFVN